MTSNQTNERTVTNFTVKVVFKPVSLKEKPTNSDISFNYGEFSFDKSIKTPYNVSAIDIVKLSPNTTLMLTKISGLNVVEKEINNPYNDRCVFLKLPSNFRSFTNFKVLTYQPVIENLKTERVSTMDLISVVIIVVFLAYYLKMIHPNN
ncbi:hypothetical protein YASMINEVIRUS_1235 [Yasminevirus sp. GU-2018]|uniref:Uncharacterized protein n=1 Tax=Yasminevirus sp. GU-2018 TaxID=2420051 RepID=A0A5K0UB09_9VIRU|nr:hypothetical protein YASMINEVIRUS_1235 [Yasminevirus sp. GU-2018]